MKRAIIVSVLEQIEKNLEERIDIEKLVVITGYSRRSLQDFLKKVWRLYREIYQTTQVEQKRHSAKADLSVGHRYRVQNGV